MNKIQVFQVHGGMTFKNKKDYLEFLKNRSVSIEPRSKWNDEYLQKKLGERFEIIKPRMPLQDNAKYDEWKIHFERFFPYFIYIYFGLDILKRRLDLKNLSLRIHRVLVLLVLARLERL